MRNLLAVGLTLLFCATVAGAQTIVKANQGQPGTQGAWPVTIYSTALADGGTSSATSTYPVQCADTALDGGTVEQTTTVGGTATQVPTNPSAGRVYVNICNSAQNASTAIIKCRQDGTAPVYASGNPGQVLLFGDCMVSTASTTANMIRCIADAAGREVTTYECIPR